MAHLIPYPFGKLVTRVLRELDAGGAVLDLPREKITRGPNATLRALGNSDAAPPASLDWSVRLHGERAATPLGPAAGPHTQLPQNLLLGYLAGARIFELKTVQIQDELAIPRPCIDVRTVGYNVEWSQELKLEQSLEEYVKASMLLEIAAASGKLELEPGFDEFLFDMSVGYDLAGIQHERVQTFLDGMLDARAIVDRLRREIPAEWKHLRELPFKTKLSSGITLSTFHGCPPGEIEGIARHLMEKVGVHCIVKLNPTLNGPVEARRILKDVLGYGQTIPDSAFTNDPTFDEACAMVTRLESTTRACGRGFGVKFSNTLVVENPGDFLPKTEKLAYLSGAPLHVLATTLVRRFRDVFEDRVPISFSAGIDRKNFPDAVALGLVPVTVCTDLLRPGGYARAHGYLVELAQRMRDVGATTIEEFTLRAHAAPAGAPSPLSAARLHNTRLYAASLLTNPRYTAAQNAKPPKKVGTRLELFDCVSCDKCVPVCPNHANFRYTLPKTTLPVVKLVREHDGSWTRRELAPLVIEEQHQWANFADFCNECGNCDVFCPEDGGPYVVKPRFFGSRAQWERWTSHDGFFVTRELVLGRFDGRAYELEQHGARVTFRGPGFELEFDKSRLDVPLSARADVGVEADLTHLHILRWLRDAVLGGAMTYVSA
ncbi:MAG: glutamate synthase [Planctomycetes bacterium]|nr:glutamate synthase [Planctomycetota bacterium]